MELENSCNQTPVSLGWLERLYCTGIVNLDGVALPSYSCHVWYMCEAPSEASSPGGGPGPFMPLTGDWQDRSNVN